MDAKVTNQHYKSLLKQEIYRKVKHIPFNYGVFICIIAYYSLLLPTLLWVVGCAVHGLIIIFEDAAIIADIFRDSNGDFSLALVDLDPKVYRFWFPLRIYTTALVFFGNLLAPLFLRTRYRRPGFMWRHFRDSVYWAAVFGFYTDLALRSAYNLAVATGVKATVAVTLTLFLWTLCNSYMMRNKFWMRSVWERYEDPSGLWPLYWNYTEVKRKINYVVRYPW